MSALAVCCRGYGREAMAGHLNQVCVGRELGGLGCKKADEGT